ncbi:MAG TPA: serine/threonine-protein kinase [Solirubrobacterales bacterium]|jgi:serine/threonine protein kinase
MEIRNGAVLKDRYRLDRPLGRGGMASVWRGHDSVLDRPVAVKILSDAIASEPEFLARFRREATVAAGLSHPNLVRIFDYAEADERPYLVMELVPGEDLGALISRGETVDRPQLARQLLAALAPIHRAGIVHRDVKPQNVLLEEDGNAKLIDFAGAKQGAGAKHESGASQQASPAGGAGESGDSAEEEASETSAAPATEGAEPSGGASTASALNEQGYELIQAGRYEEAVPVLEDSVGAFPAGSSDVNYAYALFNLGDALLRSGRAKEAIPILDQRLRIPNQTAVVRHELETARSEAGATGGSGLAAGGDSGD